MTKDLITANQVGTLVTTERGEKLAAIALSNRRRFNDEYMDSLAHKGCSVEAVDEAKIALRSNLVEAKIADPRLASPDAARLRDAIAMIGRRIRPDMSPAAAKDWVAAMVMALRSMPYGIAIEAAGRALEDGSIEFPGQVQGAIEREAKPIRQRYSLALSRLDRLRRYVGAGAPMLAPADPLPPLDQKMIDDLASSEVGRTLLAIGEAGGFLVKDDLMASGYRLTDEGETSDV